MNHRGHRLVLAGAILAFAVSVAGAQTTPTPSSPPGARGAQGAPPPMTASPPQEKVARARL